MVKNHPQGNANQTGGKMHSYSCKNSYLPPQRLKLRDADEGRAREKRILVCHLWGCKLRQLPQGVKDKGYICNRNATNVHSECLQLCHHSTRGNKLREKENVVHSPTEYCSTVKVMSSHLWPHGWNWRSWVQAAKHGKTIDAHHTCEESENGWVRQETHKV